MVKSLANHNSGLVPDVGTLAIQKVLAPPGLLVRERSARSLTSVRGLRWRGWAHRGELASNNHEYPRMPRK